MAPSVLQTAGARLLTPPQGKVRSGEQATGAMVRAPSSPAIVGKAASSAVRGSQPAAGGLGSKLREKSITSTASTRDGSSSRPGSGSSQGSRSPAAAPARKPALGSSKRVASTPAAATYPKAEDSPKKSEAPKTIMQSVTAAKAAADKQILIDPAEAASRRSAFVKALGSSPHVDAETDSLAFYGRVFHGGTVAKLTPPVVKWASKEKPRKSSPDWLTATEYRDTPATFSRKINVLASLLTASQRTLAYTGAGLSVAAGIGMAAKGSTAQGGMGVASAGEPTLSHFVMAELNRQGLLHGWVQQNHDGLPQKAGYKQEDINEIHGSWFDPSNPVVKYSGSLRMDLCEDMGEQATKADLVLVVGTSLTGLNADQCVHCAATRSEEGRALGSVIIGPQRTDQDGDCTLRIFATADEVMRALAEELGFGPRALGQQVGVRCSADRFSKAMKVVVPYDESGKKSSTVNTYWDLSKGQKVLLSHNNNIKGAKQPGDANIKPQKTIGTVVGVDKASCCITINFEGTNKKLGLWWLDAAQRGVLQTLPVVNVSATVVDARGSAKR
eukprot:TRINITY_DN6309_c0_g1_i2.p1 TRINITY_DN6309_c0_g1~~TRINITY_DN6309_c0_g1_i2.p1  ORF type:complete len:568 (-),score=118.86 TRINITY_DN6309_c0_g1_i2:510-2180(-)